MEKATTSRAGLRWPRLAAVAAATAALLFAAAAPSTAAQPDPAAPVKPAKPGGHTAYRLLVDVTQDGVNMRACASTSCPITGTASRAHVLTSWCYVEGQQIGGTPYWDVIQNRTTGRVGYITEFYLTDTTQADIC